MCVRFRGDRRRRGVDVAPLQGDGFWRQAVVFPFVFGKVAMRQLMQVVEPANQRPQPALRKVCWLSLLRKNKSCQPSPRKTVTCNSSWRVRISGSSICCCDRSTRAVAVQIGLDFKQVVRWDGAFEYFDVVAVVDLEMECASGLEEGAGVGIERGVLEAEKIRIVRRLGCGESAEQHGRHADLLNDLHGQLY